jgi:predicted nuclease with TOPRIM domain
MQSLESRLEALSRRIGTVEDENEALRDKLAERERRIQELEDTVATLEDSVEIINGVQRESLSKTDLCAIKLIRQLHNEAKNTNNHATTSVSDAVEKVLDGSVHRTQMYGETGVFQRAEDAVGDRSVLKFVQEDRADPKPTRLKINLNKGTIPKKYNGVELREADR